MSLQRSMIFLKIILRMANLCGLAPYYDFKKLYATYQTCSKIKDMIIAITLCLTTLFLFTFNNVFKSIIIFENSVTQYVTVITSISVTIIIGNSVLHLRSWRKILYFIDNANNMILLYDNVKLKSIAKQCSSRIFVLLLCSLNVIANFYDLPMFRFKSTFMAILLTIFKIVLFISITLLWEISYVLYENLQEINYCLKIYSLKVAFLLPKHLDKHVTNNIKQIRNKYKYIYNATTIYNSIFGTTFLIFVSIGIIVILFFLVLIVSALKKENPDINIIYHAAGTVVNLLVSLF